jgi:hypothetical protein
MEFHPNRPSLPDLYTFERQFQQKYGRKMNHDERRTFESIEQLLLNAAEEDHGEERSHGPISL